MPITKKAMRHKRKKVLTKRMKEQTRNAATIVKRIAKIKKELWELELEDFQERDLLSKLTWTYQNRVRLFGCTAIGFTSTENVSNSKAVGSIQKWTLEHEDKEYGDVRLFRKSIDGYTILMALQMDYAEDYDEDDDTDPYDRDKNTLIVTVFAIDVQETGTGHDAEKVALTDFAEKWNLEAEIK